MLKPIRGGGGKGRTAQTVGLPAPHLGLNSRDRLEEAKPGYASIMDNFYPGNGEATLRSGYAQHATGLPASWIESLMEYAVGTNRKLFAAVGTAIYDATAAGAVGAAAVSGLANAIWSHTMYGTTGGQFLVCVNGADGVRTFDGAAWATQAITGATASTLITVTSHKARLWFAQNNTLSAWYLPSLVIAGAAVKFDLAPFSKHGGTLVAMSGWSVDAGDGADDYLVFVTSEGECLIYSGTDPASAATWFLIGVYKTDRPLGRRCLRKLGADLMILTETGVVSVAALLGVSSRWAQISELVRPDFLRQSQRYGAAAGWEVAHYNRRGWLIVNAPSEGEGFMQFAYNSQMKAPDGWFTMSSQDGRCWGELDGDLYFGGLGIVYQADNGTSDDGDEVVGDLQWAWSRLGTPQKKRFTLARPHMRCDIIPAPSIDIRVDYDLAGPRSEPTLTDGDPGAAWDDMFWDTSFWAGSASTYSQFIAVSGMGHVAAMRLRFATSTATVFAVIGTELTFETGGIL